MCNLCKGGNAYGSIPKITEACKTTGLSQYFLRQGCKDGTIPHIKSGGVYYINVQALVEQLGKKEQSD